MSQTSPQYDWLGRRPTRRSLAVVLLVLIVLPWLVGNRSLAIQVLIWGLFALSYNLLLGYTGLLSFSHASFFGIGAYAAGLWLKHVSPTLLPAFAVAAAASGAAALAIGWLSLRRRGVTFAMLTFAFCQMVYFLGFQVFDAYTGGDDGLSGVPTPAIHLPGVGELSLISVRYPLNFYYFALVVVVAAGFVLWRLVHSPFGHALMGIRESEERARAIGYDVRRVQLVGFTFAGAVAGVAGVLNTLYLAYVPIYSLHLQTSGDVLMMTILGGKDAFIGPLLGALLYWLLADSLSNVTEYWSLAVGAVFMVTVLLFPNGLAGMLRTLRDRRILAGRRHAQAGITAAAGVGTTEAAPEEVRSAHD